MSSTRSRRSSFIGVTMTTRQANGLRLSATGRRIVIWNGRGKIDEDKEPRPSQSFCELSDTRLMSQLERSCATSLQR
jgi:hypothetical protein